MWCLPDRRPVRAAAFALVALFLPASLLADPQPFRLAPAVAVEAEDFRVEKGWEVVCNGGGNYMVDIIGFNHISGERLLCADKADTTATAHADVEVPADGDYRLWVRYEYPTFSDTRFRVTLSQNGRTVAAKDMGARDSPRLAFGDLELKPQYDPPWGSEGLVEEVVDAKGLKAGAARITLQALAQPQVPGRSANRNIDVVYLSADTKDTWRAHYRKRNRLYPILDAVRDTVGARWEMRLRNKADAPARLAIYHVYNRIPWGVSEGTVADKLAPGAVTGWVGLRGQDTAHFGMTRVTSKAGPFTAEVRPAGGGKVMAFESTGDILRLYLPPYDKYGERPLRPETQQRRVLEHLARQPKIGRPPTLPLCYGGWIDVGAPGEYGANYARIYKAIGLRSFHAALRGKWENVVANLSDVGIPLNRSCMILKYRYAPTAANIEKAANEIAAKGIADHLKWFDYGDEIHFAEWMSHAAQAGLDVNAAWRDWLRQRRPGFSLGDYWLAEWGTPDAAKLRPFSDGQIARRKPKLFVDSLIFYEDTAIAYVARGMTAVKKAFGDHVLCGANYSGHPFYHPTVTMYVKWFRGGAADFGRHSEYFWQVNQPSCLVNGYTAEHFRAGFRHNPKAVLRQYTMPHAPGNTEASFLRTCYTHLAHGAKMLDFFGIGMNECFTENHIDHRRAPRRYAAIRDVTHSMGLVEDLVLASRVAPSKVALLVSDSTERWDLAGVTADRCRHDYYGRDFRSTRLTYHVERLGIWMCLTLGGYPPDLLVEADLNAQMLAGYKVLYVVGDHLPVKCVGELERWVRAGGFLFATAGAGRFDEYGRPNPAMNTLLGLSDRKTEEKTRFLRPGLELPFLDPLGHANLATGKMPILAVRARVSARATAAGDYFGQQDDGRSAGYTHHVGKGDVYYIAALPGVACLWTAYQPPAVPDRGPGVHRVLTKLDPTAAWLLRRPLRDPSLNPCVVIEPGAFDARLIESPKGCFLVLANYREQVGGGAGVTVWLPGPVRKVTSAHCGELEFTQGEGFIVFCIPKLGYGDIVRIDP